MALIKPKDLEQLELIWGSFKFLVHLAQQNVFPLRDMPEDLPQEFEPPPELKQIFLQKYDQRLQQLKAAVAALPDRGS